MPLGSFFRVEDILKYSFRKGIRLLAVLCFFSFTNLFAFSQANNDQDISFGGETLVTSEQTVVEEDIAVKDSSTTSESEIKLRNDEQPPARRTAFLFIRMILVLALVIAIILVMSRIIKKRTKGPGKEDEFLRDVASIAVGPNKSVHVVTLIDKAYLIGVSDNSVNLISQVEDDELINAMNVYADTHTGQKRMMSFEDVLGLFTQKSSRKSAADSETETKNSKSTIDGATKQILSKLRKQSKRLDDEE